MSTKLDHLEAEAHQNQEAYESLQELFPIPGSPVTPPAPVLFHSASGFAS